MANTDSQIQPVLLRLLKMTRKKHQPPNLQPRKLTLSRHGQRCIFIRHAAPVKTNVELHQNIDTRVSVLHRSSSKCATSTESSDTCDTAARREFRQLSSAFPGQRSERDQHVSNPSSSITASFTDLRHRDSMRSVGQLTFRQLGNLVRLRVAAAEDYDCDSTRPCATDFVPSRRDRRRQPVSPNQLRTIQPPKIGTVLPRAGPRLCTSECLQRP